MIYASSAKASRKRIKNSTIKWLRPYKNATDGGENVMIRFLDDPDTPHYVGTWMKADKNAFHQARGPGGPKQYVFNPNSWVYDFKDSLTAVSVANEYPYPGNSVPNQGWGSKRGVTLITKRHILSCGHGPLGMGTLSYPTKVRFLGTDGNTYERILIGEKYCYYDKDFVTVNGVNLTSDCWVGTLNEDLPDEVIPVRCIPNHEKFKNKNDYIWDVLFVSQSYEMNSDTPTQSTEQKNYYGNFIPTNYPLRHRSMCCLYNDFANITNLYYRVWGGDSGMPLFYAYKKELLFSGFVPGGGVGPTSFPVVREGVTITWEELMNQMISDADEDAITRGLGNMSEPTGYTISLANEIPDKIPS